jgi:hypothetical protein
MPRPVVVASRQKQIELAPISQPEKITFLGTSFDEVSRALAEAFGEFPIRLKWSHAHVLALSAMAAVAGTGRGPYEEIGAALERYRELELRVL